MKRAFAVAMIALIAVSFSGCAINMTAANGKLSYGTIPGKAGDAFVTSKGRVFYFLHPSVAPIGDKSNENLDALIDPQIEAAKAKGATNITITYGMDILGFVFRYFFPFFGFDYVIVQGQFVK
jgi:hypothetical protein